MVTARGIGPVAGANVSVKVFKPDGSSRIMPLFDDGRHRDGERDDGAYANLYCDTSLADLPASALGKPWSENEEPRMRGSYDVVGTAVLGDIRREARASFVMAHDKDDDGDGMPDSWEASIDPTWPSFNNAQDDPDRDNLINISEFLNGTHPLQPDTDRGGETDGSEVTAGRDPLLPTDDQIAPVLDFWLLPDNGLVRLRFLLGNGSNGYRIWRRLLIPSAKATAQEGWDILGEGSAEPGQPVEFSDTQVSNDQSYEYQVQTLFVAKQGTVEGAMSGSLVATPKADPAPPSGLIEINNSERNTMSSGVLLNISATDATTWEEVTGPEGLHEPRPLAEPHNPPAEMRIRNDPYFPEDDNADWVSYDPNAPWDLGTPDSGLVTVYAQFRDASGNISRDVATDSIYYCQPDLDNDKLIEVSDIMQFAQRWGAVSGSAEYEDVYDMDGDLDVDIVDVMMAAGWFNVTCS